MITGIIWGMFGFVACAALGPSVPVAVGVTVVTAIIGALKAGG